MEPIPDGHSGLIAALLGPQPALLGPPQAQLTFYDGQYLLQYEEQGQRHAKLLSGAALAAAFSGQPVDSSWLPPGTVRWGEGAHGAYGVRFFPPGVHRLPILLTGQDTIADLAVPLPALVFAGRGTHYWIWAVPGATFDPQAPAYAPPLPNVQGVGAICFGATNPAPVFAAATFSLAWTLFCTTPFNDHVAGHKSQAFPNDVRAHLELLAEREATAYPFDDLFPYRNYQGPYTVAELVERVLVQGEAGL